MFNLKKINFIIDYSEFYDFELVNDTIEKNIDVILDFSEYYDFELTNIEIDLNDLIEMVSDCVDCNDAILSINSEYGFLLNDEHGYLIKRDGGFLLFH